MNTPPSAPAAPPAPFAPAAPGGAIEAHPVEFTGSGAEYFRVWIVNVVLSVVTLGLYTPWARRRTAQYFYGHTQVAGSPLEFAAEVRRMVFGFLVFAGLYAAYQLARGTGQTAAAALLAGGVALLAPLLWGGAMRFRLGSMRWRGIRMAFTARWGEVYGASWPVFAAAGAWVAAFAAAAALSPRMPLGIAQQPGDAARLPAAVPATGGIALLALLATLFCVIRLEYNYRRLFFSRARVGGQMGRFKPAYGDFVRLWLAVAGLFVAMALALGVLGAAAAAALAWHALRTAAQGGLPGLVLAVLATLALGFLALLVATLPARAFREARLFQLVWNNVGLGQLARSRSSLRVAPYVWLRMKNVALTFITLGLYRPFARVSEYAAKVGSITLYVRGGLDQLEGELVRQQGAFGDAMADAFGLDLIG